MPRRKGIADLACSTPWICDRGHQVPAQSASCLQCAKDDARADKARKTAALASLPDPYVLRDYHGRVVGRFPSGGPKKRLVRRAARR